MSSLSNFGVKKSTITPEMRAKGRETRLANILKREVDKFRLKLDYCDCSHWSELASKFKIRMPHSEEVVDVSTIRKYLKRAGVSVDTWNEHYTSMAYFVKNNPKWTKYAAVGLILELKQEYEKGI